MTQYNARQTKELKVNVAGVGVDGSMLVRVDDIKPAFQSLASANESLSNRVSDLASIAQDLISLNSFKSNYPLEFEKLVSALDKGDS